MEKHHIPAAPKYPVSLNLTQSTLANLKQLSNAYNLSMNRVVTDLVNEAHKLINQQGGDNAK